MRRGVLLAALAAIAAPAAGGQRQSFETLEVRQLVTVRWGSGVPFGARPAMDMLVDVYRQTPAVVRMRGFQQAHSTDPFDLVMMTSYRGFEGFEQARKQMVGQRTNAGGTFFTAQRHFDEASEWHRDEFLEMLPNHDHKSGSDPRVFVFEWVRLVPAAHRAYELLLQTAVVPWERERTFLYLTETGRVLVGDGWDYVRILGFETLSGYQDYLDLWRDRSEAEQLALHVSARKVAILREDESFRIR